MGVSVLRSRVPGEGGASSISHRSSRVHVSSSGTGCDDHPVRRLLVVDFANIAHRAYFAGRSRPAFAPDGRPVFLVGTFLRLVLARIREEQATHVALAFESTTGSRRREIDPGYKPRKAQEPDDLVPQLRDANIAAGRMGWARYRAEGWEADDAMASIADAAVAAGVRRGAAPHRRPRPARHGERSGGGAAGPAPAAALTGTGRPTSRSAVRIACRRPWWRT